MATPGPENQVVESQANAVEEGEEVRPPKVARLEVVV
jgi:hypothetical protein